MVIQLWHRLIWSEQGSVKETSPSRSILFLVSVLLLYPCDLFLAHSSASALVQA